MSYLSDKKVLYLFSKNYRIEVKNKKIYIYKFEQKIDEIPFFSLTTIVINYNCIIDQKLFKYATENKIAIIFIDGNFNFIASIKHPDSKNIFLRKLQYEKFTSRKDKLYLSKNIIKAKLINSAKIIKQPKESLKLWLDILENAQTIDEIRGIEGSFASFYFHEFGKQIRSNDFQWKGRFKYPAVGEINALLSWGYTLLGVEIQTFCEIIGLDPYLGFMHTDYYGRPSLVCDLQEIFRACIVDRFVLNLINLKQIRKEHFKNIGGQTRLNSEGYKIFQNEWLERIRGRKKYEFIYINPTSYRGVIEIQTRLLSKYLTDELEFKTYIL